MIRYLRQYLACRRLQKLVDARRKSYEHRRFVEHSRASKKGWAHRRSADRASQATPGAEFHRLRHSVTIPCAGDRW
jgi:hypothetical protein